MYNLLFIGGFGPRIFLDKDDGGGEGDGGEKKPVPYAEHVKVRRALANAKTDLEAANAKIKGFEDKAPEVAAIAKERDEALSRLADVTARHVADTALLELGIKDPDDRAYVRDRYASAGEPGKEKPPFEDFLKAASEKRWFKSILPEQPGESAPGKAAGDAPRSDYAANRGKPAASDGKGAGDAGKPREAPAEKPAVNPNAGAKGSPGANGRPAFTRAEIAAMDPTEYKANREAIRDAQQHGRIE